MVMFHFISYRLEIMCKDQQDRLTETQMGTTGRAYSESVALLRQDRLTGIQMGETGRAYSESSRGTLETGLTY